MLFINNVACADAYTQAATLGPETNAKLIAFTVANNSAIMQIAKAGQPQQDWNEELLVNPTAGAQLSDISGVRFRNAVSGSIARIIAQLYQPGDPTPISGTPFTGILTASGGVTGTGVVAYQEFTAPVTIAAGNTEAAPITLVSAGGVQFDGVTTYLFETYSILSTVSPGSGNDGVSLWDMTAVQDLGRLARLTAGGVLYGQRRWVPPAGTTNYAIRAWTGAGASGVGTVSAGSGGAAAYLPGFIKITANA